MGKRAQRNQFNAINELFADDQNSLFIDDQESLNRKNTLVEEEAKEETKKNLKELQIAKTQLRTFYNFKFDGMLIDQVTVYYGNFVSSMINGKRIILSDDEYMDALNSFFATDEGRQYRYPTKQEIDDACQQVKNEIIQEELKKKASKALLISENASTSKKQSNKEDPLDDERGQNIKRKPVEEEQHIFLGDPTEEEKKQEEFFLKNKENQEALEEFKKDVAKEKKKKTATPYILVFAALLIVGVLVFALKDIILANYQTIELELASDSITLKHNEAFNPRQYVSSVTDADNVYVMYPTLDTSILGTYTVDFVATNNAKSVKRTMEVNVIDGTAPEIKLTHDEITLVRNRDEEEIDVMDYIESVTDDIDSTENIRVIHTPLEWERNEQVVTYQAFDAAGNQSTVQMTVFIEDKAECVKNATYDPETNTCSCNEGYKGDGTEACKLIPKSSGSSYSNTTSTSGTNNNTSVSGSGSNSSNSGSSSGNGGSSTPSTPSTPTSPPAASNPYVNVSGSVSVPVGTDMKTILNMASACVTSYSGTSYSVSCDVNPTVAGSGGCTITANDGASASVSVTVN